MEKNFGKYEIEKELGKGGMATIYMAMHRDLGRKVALKVMHPHLAADLDARTRFELEAKAIARLEHTNIVQVYDFGSHNECFYIAMELVEGTDAEKVVKKHGPLPAEIAAMVFCGIANGLYQAHQNGIIHRDVKLANIILKNDGLSKLSDFGVVKMEDVAGFTQADSVVGTPYYLSPEQVEGAKPSAKSDIFALGVSMYFAVSGKYHFKADTIPVAFKIISSGEFLSLKDCGRFVPADLAVIIEKCMAKDTASRYESASVVAQELNSFLYRSQVANSMTEVADYLASPRNYAKKLRESTINLRLNRAATYQEKGLIFEAIREYEAVLQQDPDNKAVRDKIKKLGAVRLAKEKTDLGMETVVMPRKQHSSPLPYIIVAAVIATAITVALYFFTQKRQDTEQAPGMDWKDSVLMGQTQPALGVPVSDTAPAKVQASSRPKRPAPQKPPRKAAVKRPAPKKRPAVKAVKQDVKAPAKEKPEKPGIAAAAPAAKPEKCLGALFVFSEIWGAITLNGRKVGKAPTKNEIPVECGRYTMKIEHPSGKRYESAIEVTAGKTSRHQITKDAFK
jgi:serine/threonine protein kinase